MAIYIRFGQKDEGAMQRNRTLEPHGLIAKITVDNQKMNIPEPFSEEYTVSIFNRFMV